MCDMYDTVVGGLCYFVFKVKKFFTGCIVCCVIKVIGFSRESQVVLVRWLRWCVHRVVYICAVIL